MLGIGLKGIKLGFECPSEVRRNEHEDGFDNHTNQPAGKHLPGEVGKHASTEEADQRKNRRVNSATDEGG